jgi:hypothetical protein
MAPPVVADAVDVPRPAPVRRTGFIIRAQHQDIELTNGRSSLEIGGHWNATVLLPEADGAGVRLGVTPQGLLQVANTGKGEVFTGALSLPVGSTRVLPKGVITLRIGRESVVALPSNSLVVDEEEE